jgi:hypothetical protein
MAYKFFLRHYDAAFLALPGGENDADLEVLQLYKEFISVQKSTGNNFIPCHLSLEYLEIYIHPCIVIYLYFL